MNPKFKVGDVIKNKDDDYYHYEIIDTETNIYYYKIVKPDDEANFNIRSNASISLCDVNCVLVSSKEVQSNTTCCCGAHKTWMDLHHKAPPLHVHYSFCDVLKVGTKAS